MSHLADSGNVLDLSTLGYGGRWPALLDEISRSLSQEGLHGRVVRADRGAATVATTVGPRRVIWTPATPPPVTGDWVVITDDRPDEAATLIGVAPRASAMTRPTTHGQRSSNDPDQVLAANVDLVGVVAACDGDLNVRRLERGIVMAWESGAQPLVLLTKVDLCEDLPRVRAEAEATAAGVEVLEVSPVTGAGLDALRERLTPDRTLSLLGASGVGKSTLTNALAGSELLATRETRAVDGKGRHTTTHRELVALPSGGAVLDTPGLRTLGLGQVEEGMSLAFPEIDQLAGGCRFTDCRHDTEPGCAVTRALEDGTLDPDRFEGFVRIRTASENAALRADTAAWRREARSWGRVQRDAMRIKQQHRP